MSIKISSEQLKLGINICSRFVPLRPTLPVLSNIRLQGTKTKIKLSATNLESSVTVELPAAGEAWETTVPAKLLVEFLNLVKGSETKITLDKDKVNLVSGMAEGNFNTINANEFPAIPGKQVGALEIGQKELYLAVQNIAFAASSDEGKPVLNGILLRSVENKTLLVATDSYRLARFELTQDYNLTDLIVPARAFAEAVKIAGELGEEVISLGSAAENNQLFVSGENFQISTRLIDGVYPAFEQIIPHDFVCEVMVDKQDLISAVKQAAVFARDTGNVVKLFITKKAGVKVWASTKQVGEGSATVAAAVSGEDLNIAFNSRFLLDGLEACSGKEVKLRFSGELRPGIVTGDNEKEFNYVVMPVKPQN